MLITAERNISLVQTTKEYFFTGLAASLIICSELTKQAIDSEDVEIGFPRITVKVIENHKTDRDSFCQYFCFGFR